MNTMIKVAAAVTVGLAAAHVAPAFAQEAGKQEISIYGGALFGDRITDVAIAGQRPELDDKATFGLRYGYNYTERFGLELSGGFSPNSVTKLVGGDVDLNLYTVDLDAVWHFAPGAVLSPYVLAGVGYASADLDRPLLGNIEDDDGFTLNAGVGLKYAVSEHVVLRGELRYRYLDKVIDRLDSELNTVETTLGIGWRF